MAKKGKTKAYSLGRIEHLEVRQVMSADPLAEMLGAPLVKHGAPPELPDVVGHGWLDEAPLLAQHGQPSPRLLPPDSTNPHWREADFWIDRAELLAIDEPFGHLEQLLNSAHNVSGLTSVRNDYGLTGAGQTVVVIDSGIAYDHYALGGGFGTNYRVVGGWDFAENDADPYDDGPEGAHGTHVAGIIGGTGSLTGQDVGVAPGVDIIGLRVFNDEGNGSFSWVEKALQWVHQNRNSFENPITTVNISLGTTWNQSFPPGWSVFVEDDLAQLVADGIFISVSAGNDFAYYSTPGLSYPASSPYVVPVMSMTDGGSLSGFSQRLDRAIAAPGQTIRSTIPDYAGNHNGVTDDWANYSGTSMAAPYVGGAAVLMREAMELVGWTGITQETIYDLMMDTADVIFDSVTGINYKRLNLAAAFDAIMPADDFGSSIDVAHGLGNLVDATQLSGMISTLGDIDYFTFTAGTNGTVTFSADTTHNLVATWQLTDSAGTQNWQAGSDCTFDVVAGQTYTVGIKTAGGIGYYDINISVEDSFIYDEWGVINGQSLYSNVHTPGDRWVRVTAGQAGYLTAEALFAPAGGNVAVAIYNSQLQLVASGSSTASGTRADYQATQGEVLFVRLTGVNGDLDVRLSNQVARQGSTVSVTGTGGSDNVTFSAGANHALTVNGVDYSFAAAQVGTFVVDGGGGTDTLHLTGTTGSDTVTVTTSQVSLASSGLSFTASGFENVTSYGGGGSDTALLYDSAGDDQVVAWSDRTTLTMPGMSVDVWNYSSVTVYASSGNDTALMYGTDGDDIYTTWWNRAVLYGDGYWNDLRGFDRTEAHAGLGNDRAVLRDTAGNDTFTSWWNRAVMYGDNYWNDARGFDRVDASATEGDDKAVLRDSNGDDTFSTWSDRALMYGANYWNDARGFDKVYGQSNGGNDTAVLRDSAGDDQFVAQKGHATMQGAGYLVDARGFATVRGMASSGRDVAFLYDTDGDDTYTAWPTKVVLSGAGYTIQANDFDETQAFASGGYDQAFFYDSAGDDVYSTWWNRGLMYSNTYWNDARGFDTTSAISTQGQDRAVFRDRPGLDQVFASGFDASIQGATYRHEGMGFGRYDLQDTDGEASDQVSLDAVDAVFNINGNWTMV